MEKGGMRVLSTNVGLLLAIFVLFVQNEFTMASAPAPFSGPDTYKRYIGTVESIQIVKKTIGTSDITGEERQFLELTLKVEDAEIIEVAPLSRNSDELITSKSKSPSNENQPKPAKVAKAADLVGKSLMFYFAPSSKIEAGDRLEVTTKLASVVRRGWVGEQHGASFKKLTK